MSKKIKSKKQHIIQLERQDSYRPTPQMAQQFAGMDSKQEIRHVTMEIQTALMDVQAHALNKYVATV